MFHFEKPLDKQSFVAVDDVTVLSHQCELPVDCDFDSHRYCSYSPYDDQSVGYNFEVFATPTPDPNWPGPRFDHTTQRAGGGYLFFTSYRSTGNLGKARLISGARSLSDHHSHCLSMWTQLNSKTSHLNVSIVRYGPHWTDQNRTMLVVEMTGTVQQSWTLLTVTLNRTQHLNYAYELQVLIEGSVGNDGRSSIAIDDIKLTIGECDYNAVRCENGTLVSVEKICDFVKDCPSGLDEAGCGNCDFETGMWVWWRFVGRG